MSHRSQRRVRIEEGVCFCKTMKLGTTLLHKMHILDVSFFEYVESSTVRGQSLTLRPSFRFDTWAFINKVFTYTHHIVLWSFAQNIRKPQHFFFYFKTDRKLTASVKEQQSRSRLRVKKSRILKFMKVSLCSNQNVL